MDVNTVANKCSEMLICGCDGPIIWILLSAADRMGNFIVYVSDDAISAILAGNLVVSESVEGYPSVILDLKA